MKKFLLPIVTVLTLIACDSKPEGYTINGTLRGEVADSTRVFLTKVGEQRQRVDLDSTYVKDGSFTFNGIGDSIPAMRYLFIDELPGYAVVIVENGTITFNAQKDSLMAAELAGTAQNDIYTGYIKNSREIQEKAQSIQMDMQKAQSTNDEATVSSLKEEFMELQDDYKKFDMSFIKDNPTSLIAGLLLERAVAQRALEYTEASALYEGLSPVIKATEAGKNITTKLEEIKVREERSKSTAIGATAPDFSAPTPSGEQLALKDVLGKVTLIDFWAAWCGPCRKENPNVVAVYKKYHDKGLNIIGVSLDRKAEDWKKAIEEDGLHWNQVSNIAYFNDPIAQLYNVDGIPAAFLLDENGVIVAKNLRGPELEAKVAELLN